jgi:hypothetical protein
MIKKNLWRDFKIWFGSGNIFWFERCVCMRMLRNASYVRSRIIDGVHVSTFLTYMTGYYDWLWRKHGSYVRSLEVYAKCKHMFIRWSKKICGEISKFGLALEIFLGWGVCTRIALFGLVHSSAWMYMFQLFNVNVETGAITLEKTWIVRLELGRDCKVCAHVCADDQKKLWPDFKIWFGSGSIFWFERCMRMLRTRFGLIKIEDVYRVQLFRCSTHTFSAQD